VTNCEGEVTSLSGSIVVAHHQLVEILSCGHHHPAPYVVAA
jgi:hypothetical protein